MTALTIGRRRLTLWIALPLLMLSLNFTRDLLRIRNKYDWDKVERSVLHRGVSTPGVMEAASVAEIKSEVDETVEEKMVKEGDAVKTGQPLLRLSRTRTQLEYEQKRNSHQSLEADYKKAMREVSVQRKLLKNLAVSRQQVEDAEQALEKARASLQISQQEFDLMKKKLDSTLVKSPMNGVVLKDYTKLGANVSTGKEIITVGDVSKFIVRSKVDELDIQQVSVGQSVDITADAFPGKVMKGVVESIASQAERETFAKIEVIVNITDPAGLTLKHNLSVRINIVTEEISSALSVPIRSVLKKEGDNALVIIRGRLGLVRKRRLKLGRTAGEAVEVMSGVREGEYAGSEKPSDRLP